MAKLTSENFIKAVERAITVPSYQARFSQDDILALAQEELQICIYPMMKSIREEFFVYSEEATAPIGQETFNIPVRAAGRGLREIQYRTSTNEIWGNIARQSVEDFRRGASNASGRPQTFMIMGDKVYIQPTPSIAGTVLFWYFIPHNQLVLSDAAFTITAVNDDNIEYTGTLPDSFIAGSSVDIIQGYGGYQLALRDALVSSVSSSAVYLTGYSALNPITDVAVGDYCAMAGQTPIVMLPDEVQTVLIQATALRINQALGSMEQVKLSQDRLDKAMRACTMMLTPRVEGEIMKIVQQNGLLRRAMGRRFPSVTV